MNVLRGHEDRIPRSSGEKFAAGLVIGLAIGWLASIPRLGEWRWSQRARDVVSRSRPSRLRRRIADRRELDALEEVVLSAFLADGVLGERAVDIAAISPGMVELTGMVNTEEESHLAATLARSVPGVLTVVNRLAVSGAGFPPAWGAEGQATFSTPVGRVGGMGRRRQSLQTDPDQPDDSRKLREEALAAADRDQWEEEGFLPASGAFGEETVETNPTNFSSGELDNQDPRSREPE